MDRLPADQPDPVAAWDLARSSPHALWSLVASELLASAASARHSLHLPTLVTIGPDGSPQARTVVLRFFDPSLREVWFHTDIRSGKVADILREPRVLLHWYSPTSRLQIRMPATATVRTGDARARAAWNGSATMSRACYAAGDAPGTPLDVFPPAPQQPAVDDDAGFEVFAAVGCRFDTLDLLALHAAGHQRVRLQLATDPITWQILAP
jgi:pyridoxamine 5'-phosphate oxidase